VTQHIRTYKQSDQALSYTLKERKLIKVNNTLQHIQQTTNQPTHNQQLFSGVLPQAWGKETGTRGRITAASLRAAKGTQKPLEIIPTPYTRLHKTFAEVMVAHYEVAQALALVYLESIIQRDHSQIIGAPWEQIPSLLWSLWVC